MRNLVVFALLIFFFSQSVVQAETKVVSGSVMLNNTAFPDSKKLLESFRNTWKIRVDSVDIKDKTLVFVSSEGTVMIAFLDYPAPLNVSQTAGGISWLWKEAYIVAPQHKGQVVVSIIGSAGRAVPLYMQLTKLLAGVLEQSDASGVLMTDQLLVLSKGYYLEAARNMTEDNLPVYCWVYFGLVDEAGDRGCFTYGLKEFGFQEMEINHTTHSLQEALTVLYDATAWVLKYNITLKTGQQVPLDGLKVQASISKGVYMEGSTVKLAY